MFNIFLDTTLIPKVRRLSIGRLYLTLSQPVARIPLQWDLEQHLPFVKFIGFWLGKGYYEKHAVVISTSNHISEMIDVFDYIAVLFKCNYRIWNNSLVKFDASLLKYTMMGLGLTKGKKSQKYIPGWMDGASNIVLKELVSGFLIANAKFKNKNIVCDGNNSACAFGIYTMFLKAGHITPNLNQEQINIVPEDFKTLYEVYQVSEKLENYLKYSYNKKK